MAGHHNPDEEMVGSWQPKGLKAKARKVLAEHGWDYRAFAGACLAKLLREPQRMLDFIAADRPPEKPRGRPPRTDREQT